MHNDLFISTVNVFCFSVKVSFVMEKYQGEKKKGEMIRDREKKNLFKLAIQMPWGEKQTGAELICKTMDHSNSRS